MKKSILIIISALLVIGLFAVGGCGKKTAEQPPEKEKVLRVITEAGFAPFEFKENSDEFKGFDMDLIRAIGAAEDYKVELTHMGFESLIPALNAGKADCIIAGYSMDPDRKKAVDFSKPYFDAGLIIAVPSASEGISKLDDLKGKRIGCQVATIGANAADSVKAKDPNTKVSYYDTVGEAFMEMEKGGLDAVINDQAVTAYYIMTAGKGKIKMVGEMFSAQDQYGIAVKKGNVEVLKVINDGLDKIRANGEYDKIYDKWFK